MKNSDLLAALTEKRKIKNRRGEPLSNFWEKIYRGVLLVDFCEKSKSRRIKSESRRQFIITLVSAFEVYMCDVIIILIDNKKIEVEKLNSLPRREFSIQEVVNLLKNKISPSEIICSLINFQNLEFLMGKEKHFLTEIFKIDFVNYLKTHRFYYLNENKKRIEFSFENDFEIKLKKVFQDRHKFVHDFSFQDTPTYKYLDASRKLIINFAFCIEIIASEKFRHNRTCGILEKLEFRNSGQIPANSGDTILN